MKIAFKQNKRSEMDSNSMSGHGKVRSLQGLRLIAFLGICTGHCQVSKLGAWGVSVFFVLSGFVLTIRYYDDNSLSFNQSIIRAIKRVKNLYPLHVLMMFFAIVYICILLNGTTRFIEVFSNLFLIQSWFPDMSIYFSLNGVSWFLSAILFLYMLFPCMIKTVKKMSSIRMVLPTALVAYALEVFVCFFVNGVSYSLKDTVPDLLHWTVYICPVMRGIDFFLGVCAGVFLINLKKRPQCFVSSFVESITVILIVISNCLYVKGIGVFAEEWFCNGVVYTPTSVFLCGILYLNKGVLSTVLSGNAMVYFGNKTGYMFLIHSMVIAYAKTFLQHIGLFNPIRLLIIVLPSSFVATIIYEKIEKGMQMVICKILGSERQQQGKKG